jgi:hypothetical protein
MAKNKDINISPSKGISIIIKNDFQQPPPIKPKKKRKYKRKTNLDLLKMPTMPSYIPAGDVSYIKPQYAMSSLNRNMMLPSFPQSLPQLTPPPQLPQLTAPPPQPLLPAPQPFTFSLDSRFGSMLENLLMPREYGYKARSYELDILDDDIMNALPKAQQDQYIEKKVAPQIEEQIKDIEFDNAEDKLKVYTQAVSNKTAKEWGTRHANSLKPFDPKYNDNENYRQNYISKLQEIINQDSMKTRSGTKTITADNKEKAKELLKAIGIKPDLKVVVPVYAPPTAEAPPATPPREKQARVTRSEAEAERKAEEIGKKAAEEKAKKEAEEFLRSEPPAPVTKVATGGPPPPPPPSGKGPPPPPPPPPKTVISTALLDSLGDTPEEKAAKEKAAKEAEQASKKGSMVEEMKAQQERAPKQAGTKNGKNLNVFTEKYIDNLNYRKNYKTELEKIRDDEKTSEDNKTKAKELLKTFNEELIKRAAEYAIKDTNMDTLYQFREEYKEFDEYKKPYMEKMKKHLEETRTKYEKEDKEIKRIKGISRT